jgi:membrane protease YdiL (CAAX protease family)
MSILAANPSPVADFGGGAIAILVIAIIAAFATGLFREDSVSGPSRLPDSHSPAWRLLFALFFGFTIWLLVQIIYGDIVRAQVQPAAAPATTDAPPLRAGDWAFLSTVPYAIGFLALLAADYSVLDGSTGIQRLGLGRQVVMGLLKGFVGILIAWPMLRLILAATEEAYDHFHFVHPQEHELLKVLGESGNQGVRIALIFGAVVMAPFFEEYVFRGHVQTFLRELLIRATFRRAEPEPQHADISNAGTLQYGTLQYAKPPRSVAWQTWLAIIVASAIFTSVHPLWMWPPIFFLALCLGYAYERTGSLWTTIAMHSLFNAINTFAYLSQGHG